MQSNVIYSSQPTNMQVLTAPSQKVALFQTTKEERKEIVNDLLARLDAGEMNPLQVHAAIKCMEDVIKSVASNDQYKNFLLDEAAKHSTKTFEAYNAKFTVTEAGTKYHYEACGDPVWEELNGQAKKASEALKERETFLKSLPSSGVEVITTDGEVVKVLPPTKTSTTSVTTTLK